MLRIGAEAPGFKEGEIEVNLEPGVLAIKGEHVEETERKEGKRYHSERRAHRICRRVSLPVNVVPDKATATLKDGVTEISLPKAEPAKKIPVKAA